MAEIDRIFVVNGIVLGIALVGAVVGVVIESSRIWAIAWAVMVYGGFRVGATIWLSLKLRRMINSGYLGAG